MDPRPISELLEHHVLPDLRDTISELDRFVVATEAFLGELYQRAYDDFRAKHEARGVTVLPDGTSLEQFFEVNAAAWAEGRLVRFLRHSLFVAVYAFIEFSLMELCRFLRRTDVRVAVGDLRGQNDIDRARDYMSKVLAADFPASSEEWQEIQVFRRVRNAIVHNAGEVPIGSRGRESIEQYVRRRPECLRLDGVRIVLEPAFCRLVLDVFRRFLEELAGSLVPYVTRIEANLEPSDKEFGEFYLGRPQEVGYYPPPPGVLPTAYGFDE